MRVVQFGAGNIGRGFTGQLFADAGAEVVFVDVAPEIVAALNERRSYPLRFVGPRRRETVTIRGVRAVDGRDREAVAREVAGADLVCTAVGVAALPHIAPALALGLARRAPDAPPLNVLLCENQFHTSAIVASLLCQAPADPSPLPPPRHGEGETAAEGLPPGTGHRSPGTVAAGGYGLVDAVVSRTVPGASAEEREQDPLLVVAEDYDRLPLDARAVVGALPPIPGLEPRFDFEALVQRKLFVHNMGHAVAAYLGCAAGKRTIHEALSDPGIAAVVRRALEEGSEAVTRRHGLDHAEQAAYVADLFLRFANPELGDTVERVGRDPIRKLRSDDRLVGAALLALEQGGEPAAIIQGIAAALRFDPPDDPAAVTLQTELRERGLDAVLAARCGLPPDHPLATRIREAIGCRLLPMEPT
jgi:mannitol-1-phosphate 5-dehydrogenase